MNNPTSFLEWLWLVWQDDPVETTLILLVSPPMILTMVFTMRFVRKRYSRT